MPSPDNAGDIKEPVEKQAQPERVESQVETSAAQKGLAETEKPADRKAAFETNAAVTESDKKVLTDLQLVNPDGTKVDGTDGADKSANKNNPADTNTAGDSANKNKPVDRDGAAADNPYQNKPVDRDLAASDNPYQNKPIARDAEAADSPFQNKPISRDGEVVENQLKNDPKKPVADTGVNTYQNNPDLPGNGTNQYSTYVAGEDSRNFRAPTSATVPQTGGPEADWLNQGSAAVADFKTLTNNVGAGSEARIPYAPVDSSELTDGTLSASDLQYLNPGALGSLESNNRGPLDQIIQYNDTSARINEAGAAFPAAFPVEAGIAAADAESYPDGSSVDRTQNGRVVITDANGQETFIKNAGSDINRHITAITNPDGRTYTRSDSDPTEWTITDAQGKDTGEKFHGDITEQNGNVTFVDSERAEITTINKDGSKVEISPSQTRFTDAAQHETTIKFEGEGTERRAVEVSNELGTFTRDPENERQWTKVDKNGNESTFYGDFKITQPGVLKTTDDLNNTELINYPNGSSQRTFLTDRTTVDEQGNPKTEKVAEYVVKADKNGNTLSITDEYGNKYSGDKLEKTEDGNAFINDNNQKVTIRRDGSRLVQNDGGKGSGYETNEAGNIIRAFDENGETTHAYDYKQVGGKLELTKFVTTNSNGEKELWAKSDQPGADGKEVWELQNHSSGEKIKLEGVDNISIADDKSIVVRRSSDTKTESGLPTSESSTAYKLDGTKVEIKTDRSDDGSSKETRSVFGSSGETDPAYKLETTTYPKTDTSEARTEHKLTSGAGTFTSTDGENWTKLPSKPGEEPEYYKADFKILDDGTFYQKGYETDATGNRLVKNGEEVPERELKILTNGDSIETFKFGDGDKQHDAQVMRNNEGDVLWTVDVKGDKTTFDYSEERG
ncbi:MAG: hypothetical protein R3C24_06790 [Cyanobacteriota/Melainabacteria group bacterium]